MRLDKYLKVSRLIKRRTIANEACDNGRISVNGRVVKASYEVKVGDKIEISMGPRTVAVEVLQVAETVKKDDAAAMARGERVQISGFGTFETKHRQARVGRNPATRQAVQIPATDVPAFKPAQALKDAVMK